MTKRRRSIGPEDQEATTDRLLPGPRDSAEPQGSPVDRLYGLMRADFAEWGGGEAFLKWLRTDPEPRER
jgi:hypothetical protein